jgi:hypothetical protein
MCDVLERKLLDSFRFSSYDVIDNMLTITAVSQFH